MTDARWAWTERLGTAEAPVETEYVVPRTPAEQTIARVWAEALWLDEVGAHDDFFDLGGDSLLAIQVAVTLSREFDLDVPMTTLFQHTTVESLAGLLSAAKDRTESQ